MKKIHLFKNKAKICEYICTSVHLSGIEYRVTVQESVTGNNVFKPNQFTNKFSVRITF